MNEMFILLLADGAVGVWSSLPVEHNSSCCSVAAYPFSDKALSGRFATTACSTKGWPINGRVKGVRIDLVSWNDCFRKNSRFFAP